MLRKLSKRINYSIIMGIIVFMIVVSFLANNLLSTLNNNDINSNIKILKIPKLFLGKSLNIKWIYTGPEKASEYFLKLTKKDGSLIDERYIFDNSFEYKITDNFSGEIEINVALKGHENEHFDIQQTEVYVDSLERIKKTRKIKVAIHFDQSVQMFAYFTNEYEGFDIELAKLIARKLQGNDSVEIIYNHYKWGDLIKALNNEEVCTLKLEHVNKDRVQSELVNKFEMEYSSKKQDCVMLVVTAKKNGQRIWKIAGFNDKEEFRKNIKPGSEFFKELDKLYELYKFLDRKDEQKLIESEIVEVVANEIGRTYPKKNEIDFAIASITSDNNIPGRKKIEFSKISYLETKIAAIYRINSLPEIEIKEFVSIEDLKGLKIAVHSGTTAEEFAKTVLKIPKKNLEIASDNTRLLDLVIKESVTDIVLYDEIRTYAEVASHPTIIATKKIQYIDKEFKPERYGIASIEVNKALIKKIDDILENSEDVIKELLNDRINALRGD